MVKVNTESLPVINELFTNEALEANICLFDDTIDKILNEEAWDEAEMLDYVSCYHRLSRQFRKILESKNGK